MAVTSDFLITLTRGVSHRRECDFDCIPFHVDALCNRMVKRCLKQLTLRNTQALLQQHVRDIVQCHVKGGVRKDVGTTVTVSIQLEVTRSAVQVFQLFST